MMKCVVFIIGVLIMGIECIGYEQLAVKELIRFEQFVGTVYKPTKYDVPTIGYGFTDKKLVNRKTMTETEAKEILVKLVREYGKFVDKTVTVDLNNYQKAALVVFAYNIGKGAFKSSTLLKRLNAGEVSAVPYEMTRWRFETYTENGVKKKRVLNGLVKRRIAEIKLWGGQV